VNMCFTTAASAVKLDKTTRPITICIEGNISAGKSTFLQEVLKFSDHHMRVRFVFTGSAPYITSSCFTGQRVPGP